MSRRWAAAAIPLVLLLAACTPDASESTTSASPPSSASSPPSLSPTPSPTAAPAPDALVLTLDGVSRVSRDGSVLDSIGFADGLATVEFMTAQLGADPAVTRDTNGYPFTFYEWESVRMNVIDSGSASIWFEAATANGLDLETLEGIAVGATVQQALAAGAVDGGFDFDADGASDFLELGTREAPGTSSLENPGQTGVEYIVLAVENGVVTSIQPGNDYSDI